MQKVEKNGLSFWQFDLLLECPEIVHGSFLRHGGHSEGLFASLNVSFNVGDDTEKVQSNHDLLKQTCGLSNLLHTHQFHSDQVHVIESKDEPIPACDALITQLPDTGLLIKHADCQACLIYDPIQKVIANVHAGWRGSVQKIYTKTITCLKERFGCDPKNLLVCISPSLGPKDAEFINYQIELPETFWQFQTKPAYFDFWAVSKEELRQAGVLVNHIEIAGISTYSHPEDYFSYRRQKISGRLPTFLYRRSITR